jgi:hypothetical protein
MSWTVPRRFKLAALLLGVLLSAIRPALAGAGIGQGQGMVVMTNSDNASILGEALILRAAEIYGWPALPAFAD